MKYILCYNYENRGSYFESGIKYIGSKLSIKKWIMKQYNDKNKFDYLFENGNCEINASTTLYLRNYNNSKFVILIDGPGYGEKIFEYMDINSSRLAFNEQCELYKNNTDDEWNMNIKLYEIKNHETFNIIENKYYNYQ